MKTLGKYILQDHETIACEDLMEWAKWFETADRHVAKTEIGIPAWKYWFGRMFKMKRLEPVRVSTVFLGMEHGFDGERPLLFETMIFGGPFDQTMWRYATWDEAEKGHQKAVKKAK